MTRRFTGYLLFSVLVLLIARAVLAGDAGRESPFSMGAGARALGMGGGFTSLSLDAMAVYYNPAGLSGMKYQEVALMHSMLFEGSMYDFAAWVYPISTNSGIGVSYTRLGTDEIIRRENYADMGEFDYSMSQLVVAYGRRFGRPLGLGVNLRIVNQSLADNSDYGVGLDIGLRSQISGNLAVGLIARQIIPVELTLVNTSEKMPRSVTAGVSLADLMISEDISVTLAMDAEKFDDRSLKPRAGVELQFRERYALRLGYDRDNLAFGAGLTRGRLRLDYAYKLVAYVDDMHHFSLSFLLGRPVSERRAVSTTSAAVPVVSTAPEQKLSRLKEKADSFFRRFQLDSALVYYTRIHDLDSTDEEIMATISAIEQALRIQVEREGKLREAQLDLQRYLRNYFAHARLFYDKKHYSAALDLLELIFDVEADNAEALHLRSTIREAIAGDIRANLDTARIAVQDGRTVRAIEAYNRILELDPGNQEVMTARQRALTSLDVPQQLNLGISLFERGRLVEARHRFEKVLITKPDEPVALEYLRRIEARQAAETPTTLEDLQKDEGVWQHYLNGLRYMRNGEYRKAIEEWEQVLQAYPNNPNTLNNIEQARLRLRTE